MNSPNYLVVIGHDRPSYKQERYLGNFPKNNGLLICAYNLQKGKNNPPEIDKDKFGIVHTYNFNEFDRELFKGARDNSWRLVGPFFNLGLAKRIFDDVDAGLKSCDGLIVSCNAGIVRSPTIANALNDFYDWKFKDWFTEKRVAERYREEYIYRLMKEEAKRRGLIRRSS